MNRDGHVDLFTADMMSATLAARQRQIPTHSPMPKPPGLPTDRPQWMRNTLHLARGDGTWAQIAEYAGVAATDWTWGSAFVDVDLDGYEDLLAVNVPVEYPIGNLRANAEQVPPFRGTREAEFPNLAGVASVADNGISLRGREPHLAIRIRRRDLARNCTRRSRSDAT